MISPSVRSAWCAVRLEVAILQALVTTNVPFYIGLAVVVFGLAPHILFIRNLTGLSWPALPSNLVLGVGARNSSNSNRLREVAARSGVTAHLVQDASDLQREWFRPSVAGALRVGITSGASTPELLVQSVVEALKRAHAGPVVQLAGVQEDTSFRLPAELAVPAA